MPAAPAPPKPPPKPTPIGPPGTPPPAPQQPQNGSAAPTRSIASPLLSHIAEDHPDRLESVQSLTPEAAQYGSLCVFCIEPMESAYACALRGIPPPVPVCGECARIIRAVLSERAAGEPE